MLFVVTSNRCIKLAGAALGDTLLGSSLKSEVVHFA